MDVLETLRELAIKKCRLIKVKLIKPPSYVSIFYGPEDKPSEIIFMYKEVKETVVADDVADDLSLNQGDKTPGTEDKLDLTGNPLEDPFEEVEVNLSIAHERQVAKTWHINEENYAPVSLNDARSLFNGMACRLKGKGIVGRPVDVWALTKPNSSADPDLDVKKRRHDVLLGLRHSRASRDGKPSWFARSVVTFEEPCSLESPKMDPLLLKKQHLKLCGANRNVSSKVVSIYHLSGEIGHVVASPHSTSCGSVHVEVQWREPKLEPPLHEALSVMVIHAAVGHSSSSVHPLWRQLWTLEKMFVILGSSWKDLRSFDKVPKYPNPSDFMNSVNDGAPAKATVSEHLKSLFAGAFSSHYVGQDHTGFASLANSSVPSSRVTMHKSDDISKECKLKRSIQQVIMNKRINADATDDLWTILSECDSYNDLSVALDTIYGEVKQGTWKPYLRHKNQSRTSALLKAFTNAVTADAPDLAMFEGSAIPFALESIFELGLEKLTHDYNYIFMESDLASRNELLTPSFPRKGLGVTREAWLSNCDAYLTWLSRMHFSLEAVLLTEDALSGVEQAFSSVTAQALKYFQGASSPIQSSKFITSNEHILPFRASVNSHQIGKLLSRPSDLWQLTLTTETPSQIVETVFHRSAFHIFPPQIISGEPDAQVPETDKSSYCSCKFITLYD